MREKMDARNARIAQLAKEGGYGEDGLTDEDLDPDLQLLHDEHTKQLRKLEKQLEEERKKNEELGKERMSG